MYCKELISMKIDFKKVSHSSVSFDIKLSDIVFKGQLKYYKRNLLDLDATIKGNLLIDCYLCGSEFLKPINEKINFLINDGVYDLHNDDLEVIESLNGIIDIDELLNSEIELFKSDYHICSDCKLKERN